MQAVRPTVRAVARPCLATRASPVKAVQHAVRQLKEAPASKPALTVAVTNLLLANPAQAEGKLFDFDLTLPIMAGQFLLLMVFLDNFWFKPVGKVLDERDKVIRDKLASVKGNTAEIEKMQEEAEKKVKEARDKSTAKIAEAKQKAEKEAEEEEQKLQKQLDQELQEALKELEKEREGAEKDLESQIDTLSNNIIEQMLPPEKEPATA